MAGVLSEDEVEEALRRVWNLIEGQGTGVDRADRSTWTNERWCPRTAADPAKIAGTGSGAGGYGALQSDAAWYIRGRPGLRQMWASIYGTDDLIVSWDGLNVVRPWKHDPTWRVTAQGPHIDGVRQMQSPDGRRPDGGDFEPSTRYYAQGVVNLVRSSADAGGNVVVSGSHKHYESLNRQFFSQSGEQRVTPEIVAARPEIFENNVIIAHVEPGDCVLWDDRSVSTATVGPAIFLREALTKPLLPTDPLQPPRRHWYDPRPRRPAASRVLLHHGAGGDGRGRGAREPEAVHRRRLGLRQRRLVRAPRHHSAYRPRLRHGLLAGGGRVSRGAARSARAAGEGTHLRLTLNA